MIEVEVNAATPLEIRLNVRAQNSRRARRPWRRVRGPMIHPVFDVFQRDVTEGENSGGEVEKHGPDFTRGGAGMQNIPAKRFLLQDASASRTQRQSAAHRGVTTPEADGCCWENTEFGTGSAKPERLNFWEVKRSRVAAFPFLYVGDGAGTCRILPLPPLSRIIRSGGPLLENQAQDMEISSLRDSTGHQKQRAQEGVSVPRRRSLERE